MTKKLTPYALLRNLYGKPLDWRPQWADHLSVVRTADGIVYIAEPYQLYPEAFNDFAVLEAHGWRVQVDGQTTHYPGHTVRVCMTTASAPIVGVDRKTVERDVRGGTFVPPAPESPADPDPACQDLINSKSNTHNKSWREK